jgi:checkpoint serine/threonine-protein kinase
MKVFRPDVQFIADWKTGPADCAEMRECRPWTWQIDYHGLAGIIHSMLFGKYIDTVAVGGGVGVAAQKKWKLKEGLKRYWQTELWGECFELLLNPTSAVEQEDGGKMPVLKGMKAVREKMEAWLEGNSERGVGLQGGLRRLEMQIEGRRRK